MVELSQEYEQEKKVLKERYEEKGEKRFKKFLISLAAIVILAGSSSTISNYKLRNLEKNYPMRQIYLDNQNSLRYLMNELNRYKLKRLPEFLSKDIKNELEKISVQENSTMISSLEKTIKIVGQEGDRIVNTSEFKEYSKKYGKIAKNNNFFLLGTMGILFTSLSTLFFTNRSSRGSKYNELNSLDEKYGITSSSQ